MRRRWPVFMVPEMVPVQVVPSGLWVSGSQSRILGWSAANVAAVLMREWKLMVRVRL